MTARFLWRFSVLLLKNIVKFIAVINNKFSFDYLKMELIMRGFNICILYELICNSGML